MEKQRGENPFDEPVAQLKESAPETLASLAGARWEAEADGGRLLVPVLNGTFAVRWPDITIEASTWLDSFSLKLLCLLYLTHTDGARASGKWVAYRELPGGRFYEPVVKRSVEDPLAKAYENDTARFLEASEKLGGEQLELGDASWSFTLFPNVLMAFIVWQADEEFAARAQVIFDSSAPRHLSAFDLRMGAQEISTRLVKAGKELAGG